jgi:hypothetical protein
LLAWLAAEGLQRNDPLSGLEKGLVLSARVFSLRSGLWFGFIVVADCWLAKGEEGAARRQTIQQLGD